MNLLELCKDSLNKANEIIIDLESKLKNMESKTDEDLTNSNDSSNNIDTPDELSERK